MKLTLSKDCGNSPKNELVQDVAVALATRDVERLRSAVTADIQWDIVGVESFEGLDDFLTRVAQESVAEQLEVDRVLSHGKSGAVNGRLIGPGEVERRFCHVIRFRSAKGTAVDRITSFVVEC